MPVFTAIATAIVSSFVGGAIVAGSFAAFAVSAVAFGLRIVATLVISSIIGQRSNKGGDPGAAGAQLGSRVQLPPNTDNKIPVVYGEAYMKPIITDAKISTDNQTMWYVLVFSEAMESDTIGTFSFGDIYWADKRLTFDVSDQTRVVSWTDSNNVTSTKVDGNLYMWLYRDGSDEPINSADAAYSSAVLADTSIAEANRWDNTKKMSKLVFAVMRVKYNAEADLTGLAEITAQVKNTLSAPGSVIQDYLTNPRYGPYLGIDRVNTSTLAELNSYSAEPLTYITTASTTATTSTFTINGPIDTSKNFLENITSLVDACDSWLQWDEVKGQWSVVVNQAATTASITTITSDNIFGGITIQPVDLNSTYNSIQVQYANSKARDQTGHWQLDIEEFPLIERSPNEPNNQISITLPLINNIIQAQYIAARRLLQSREDLSVNFTMDYSGIQINAGDVVGILHDRYGWDTTTYGEQGKLFRVMQVQEAKDSAGMLFAKVAASEYNPLLYTKDITTLQDFELSLNTGIQDPGVVSAPTTPTFSNVFTTTSVPSFDVSTNVGAVGGVSAMEYWYGTTSTFNSSYSLYFTEIADSGFYASGQTITSRISGLPASTYYLTTRAVASRTKSSFSTVSNALIWNPLSTSGSASTSTFSGTATDANNVQHIPFGGAPPNFVYPIAISTSTTFSPVLRHTGLGYNPNTSNLTLGGGITFTNTGSRIVADFTSNEDPNTPSSRLAFQTSITNGATGLLTVPNGASTQSGYTALASSNIDSSAWCAYRVQGNEAQMIAGRYGSTAPHLSLNFYTNGVNNRRMSISSGTGVVSILGLTDSFSTSTGILTVLGGAGFTKGITVGTTATILGATDSFSVTQGALKVSGGVGIAKALSVGTTATILATTPATTTQTGALIVSGGIGVGNSVHIAQTMVLRPLAAEPTKTTGTLAMANAVNWDPAVYSTTTPYLTYWNGTVWVAI
jgi:hypothetical protein